MCWKGGRPPWLSARFGSAPCRRSAASELSTYCTQDGAAVATSDALLCRLLQLLARNLVGDRSARRGKRQNASGHCAFEAARGSKAARRGLRDYQSLNFRRLISSITLIHLPDIFGSMFQPVLGVTGAAAGAQRRRWRSAVPYWAPGPGRRQQAMPRPSWGSFGCAPARPRCSCARSCARHHTGSRAGT